MDIAVDQGGNISVTNSGNGDNSVNNATVNSTSQNTVTQNNTANIVNNINLSANTGKNSASMNTGGNSSITTGDASIVANIVNFVNTNISSTGRLFVTVVNVFGSWLGDFVAPGQHKDNPIADNSGTGGGGSDPSTSNNSSSNSGSGGSSSSSNGGSSSSSTTGSTTPLRRYTRIVLASVTEIKDPEGDIAMAGASTTQSETAAKKVVKINLAFGIPILLLLVIGLRRRRTLAALFLKLRRK
jgi:hypothetical protein